MKRIDCRNMACPAPVVTTRKALEEAVGETVEILVDAGAPRENVTRFATSRGFTVEEAEIEGGFSLTIGTGGAGERGLSRKGGRGRIVHLITSDRFGDGPEDLGRLLMKNYLITLLDLERQPDQLLFLNTGVLLSTEGSESLEALEKLADLGVEILSCGVCLDFFHRREKLRAGGVTTMFTIANALMDAEKVIRL